LWRIYSSFFLSLVNPSSRIMASSASENFDDIFTSTRGGLPRTNAKKNRKEPFISTPTSTHILQSFHEDSRRDDITDPAVSTHGGASTPLSHLLFSDLEKTAPRLLSDSKQSWVNFLPLWRSYVFKGGLRAISSLFHDDVIYSFGMEPTVGTLKGKSNESIVSIISTFHGIGLLGLSPISLFDRIKMAPSEVFSLEKVESYVFQFKLLLRDYPSLNTTLAESDIAAHFILRLQPLFYSRILKRHYDTVADAFTAVRASFMTMSAHLEVNTLTSALVPQKKAFHRPDQPRALGRLSAAEGYRAASTVLKRTCFNCGLAHHLRDCPQKDICIPCEKLSPRPADHQCWTPGCPSKALFYSSKSTSASTAYSARATASVASAPLSTDDKIAELSTQLATLTALFHSSFSVRANATQSVRDPGLAKRVYFDSGCNSSMLASPSHSDSPILLTASDRSEVVVATGESAPLAGVGSILDMKADLAPSFMDSLVSVSQFNLHHRAISIFDHDRVWGISRSPAIDNLLAEIVNIATRFKLIKLHGIIDNGLYRILRSPLLCQPCRSLSLTSRPSPARLAHATYYSTAHLSTVSHLVQYFHEAWGHASMNDMIAIVKHQLIQNIPPNLTSTAIRKYFPQCLSCPLANLAQAPHPSLLSSRVLALGEEIVVDCKVFADAKGKRHLVTFGGNRYTFSAIEVVSGYIWGEPIKSQAHIDLYCDKIRQQIASKPGRRLKIVRTDNAFVTTRLLSWAALHQIRVLPCIPYEHYQIGRIERFHRTVEDAIVKVIATKPHLSMHYWGMAYLDYIFKHNLLPLPHDATTSAFSQWHLSRVDLSTTPMIPFGSIVMAHIPLELQKVLGGRSIETIAVGCAPAHFGGVKLFNPITKRVIIRRTFKCIGPLRPTSPVYHFPVDFMTVSSSDIDATSLDMPGLEWLPLVDPTVTSDLSPELFSAPAISPSNDINVGPTSVVSTLSSSCPSSIAPALPRLSSRFRTPSFKLRSALTSLQSTSTILTTMSIPQSFEQILRISDDLERQGYLEAVSSELASMRSMNVFSTDIPSEVSSIPKGSIIPSKFIFDKKFHPDGTFNKYKARLCARGDRYVDHYNTSTFAGTVQSESVRMMLAIAAEQDFELSCVDVRTAFLYSEIPDDEFIYIRRPRGIQDDIMPPIVRLRKYLYGLPMASAKFRTHSHKSLLSLGFTALSSDTCMYVRNYTDGGKVLIAVHVDDFGIAASSASLLSTVLDSLASIYSITTDSVLSSYLGMHITRDRPHRSIMLAQPGYILDILEQYSIPLDGSQIFPSTPMLDSIHAESKSPPLILHSSPLGSKFIKEFQARVGSLLYLANQTRPDILFAVNSVSRKAQNPTVADLAAVHRILLYVAGTRHFGLHFHSGEGIVLYATVDASYASHQDRKSHTGFTLHIGKSSGSVCSKSKKQTITADSSTVAEFIATHVAAKEIMWARTFLMELGYPQHDPTILFEDNQSTIAMINNHCNTQRTKHVDIRYNLIREQVQLRLIQMQYLPTDDMISDVLTKPLGLAPFLRLRPKLLGMCSTFSIC
jgi:hypothetical protein